MLIKQLASFLCYFLPIYISDELGLSFKIEF